MVLSDDQFYQYLRKQALHIAGFAQTRTGSECGSGSSRDSMPQGLTKASTLCETPDSVLEFAVEHLKVQHIIVCGHYGCGGIERVFAPERGELFDHWLQPVSMFYRKHRKVFDALPPMERLDRMCEVNIEMQVRRLAATPIVENAWARGQELNLHGWIYRIGTGLLHDLGPHLSSIAERDALASIDECVERSGCKGAEI